VATASFGELVLKFGADIAEVLTAVERMDKELQAFTANTTKSLSAVSGLFKSLGASLTISAAAYGFEHMIESTIAAEAELSRLADRSGTTAEALSSMRLAAEDGGISLEQVSTMSARLSKALFEAGDGSSKAAKALEQLGLDAKTLSQLPTGQALQIVADTLQRVEEGGMRTALTMELLGKGAQNAGAFLKTLADNGTVAASVTNEQARTAREAEDAFARLQDGTNKLKIAITNELLPGIIAVVNALVALREVLASLEGPTVKIADNSVKLADIWHSIANPVITLVSAYLQLRQKQEEAHQASVAFAAAMDRDRFGVIGLGEAAGLTAKQLDELNGVINSIEGKSLGFSSSFAKDLAVLTAGLQSGAIPNLERYRQLVAELLQQQPFATKQADAAKKAADEVKRLADATAAYERNLAETNTRIGMGTAALYLYGAALARVPFDKANALLDDFMRKTDAANQLAAGVKASGDAWRSVEDAITRAAASATAYSNSLEDMNKSLDTQLATMGMTNAETQIFILNQQLISANAQQNAHDIRELTIAIQTWQRIAARGDAIAAAQETERAWKQTSQNIEKALEDGFFNAFKKGESFGAGLRKALEDMFRTLVLRPLLQPIANAAAGVVQGGTQALSGVGSSLASSLTGPGSMIGSAASSLGTAALGGISTLGEGGAAFAAGAAGDAFMPALATAAGGAPAMATMGAAMAAIPVAGWIALAAVAAYSIWQANQKPSQVQAQFGIQAGTAGFEDNASVASKFFGNVGFLDAGTKQFSGQAAQAFNKIIAQALDAVGERLTGDQIDRLRTKLQGMSFAGIEGTFSTEDFLTKYGGDVLKQVLTAAFQELDKPLADVFDRFSGTADEIAKFANSLLTFEDVTKGLPDAVKSNLIAAIGTTQDSIDNINAIASATGLIFAADKVDLAKAASDAYVTATNDQFQALTAQGDALTELIGKTDDSAAAAQALATATTAYGTAAVNALIAIKQIAADLKALTASTLETLDDSIRTDDQRYSNWQAQIKGWQEELKTATDPARISELNKNIDAAVTKSWNMYLSQAGDAWKASHNWDQMTSEQQATSWAEFLKTMQGPLAAFEKVITETDTLAQQRLGAAGADVQLTAQQHLDAAADKMTTVASDLAKAADKMNTAADTQTDAANTSLTAARTPTNVNVHVDVTGTEVGNLAGSGP
jgi:hypothetical protein